MKHRTKEIVLGGLLIATGLLLPLVFHTFNMGGKIFLPMHLPVLVAGLTLTPIIALIVGILTPIFSSVLTGMPVMYPVLPIMVCELAMYGFVTALCRKKYKLGYYFSLIIGMIAGRIIAGLAVVILVLAFGENLNPVDWVIGSIVTGIPGIIFQLLLVPVLAKIIDRSTLDNN